MSDIYVVLGNTQLKETREEGLKRDGLVKLLINEELLENTYRDLLTECHGYITSTSVLESKKPTVEVIEDACLSEDQTYSVFVYNRDNKKGNSFSLEDSVIDTIGEFIYRTEHVERGQPVVLDTGEIYVVPSPMGG